MSSNVIFNLDTNTAINILNANGVPARNQGSKIAVICPFHADSDFGNAFISPDKNYLFKCYRGGCTKPTSNIAGVLMQKLNISFNEALNLLNIKQQTGIDSYVQTNNLLEPLKIEKEKKEKKKLSDNYINYVSINFDPDDYYYTKLKYYDSNFMSEFGVRKIHTGYYKDYFITNISSKKLDVEAYEFRKLIEYEKLRTYFKSDLTDLKELRSEFKDFKKHFNLDIADYTKRIVEKRDTKESFKDETLAYLLSPKVLYSVGTDTPSFLFNYDNLDFKKQLIVCESVSSIPLLMQIFKTKNITSTFGSNVSDRQIELLSQFKNLVFLPDGDDASIDSLEMIQNKVPFNLNVIPVTIKDDKPEFKKHLESFYVDQVIKTLSLVTYISRMRGNFKKVLR